MDIMDRVIMQMSVMNMDTVVVMVVVMVRSVVVDDRTEMTLQK